MEIKDRIKISINFSDHPGARYRKDGEWSGEKFLEEILLSKFEKAVKGDYILEIDANEEELREGFRKGKKYGGEHATQFFIPESRLAAFVQSNQQALTPRTRSNLRNYLLTTPTLVE